MSSERDSAPEQQARPTSPHLQIYRWQWTMVFSITHRLTGLYISAGMVFLSFKLLTLAFGDAGHFTYIVMFGHHPFFFAMKVIFTWTLLYHMLNGVRHLVWDSGAMLGLVSARASGYIVALLSVVFNLLYWI